MRYIKMKSGGTRRTVNSFAGGADMRFDEGVIGDGSGVRCNGYKFDSGALTDGYGIDEAPQYSGFVVKSIWDFTRYDNGLGNYVTIKMLCNNIGQIWYYKNGTWSRLDVPDFTSAPFALNYRLYGEDSIIIMSHDGHMVVWNGINAAKVYTDIPRITSFTMHYERMFVTTAGEQNAVYFSDDLDPTNWNETLTEGGFIQLLDERGKLLKAVDFLNYVYIFREYGISRITAYGDQQDFNVANLYVSGGKLYGGSVAQCGGCVMLLGSDGLYSFDGYDMTRRLKNICFEPSPAAHAVYFDGKYYLTARLKDFGGNSGENNALVVYDVSSGGYSVVGLSLAKLMTTEDGIFALTTAGRLGQITDSGYIFGQMLSKEWESGYSDFGTPKKKTLSEISVVTKNMVQLTIIADGKERLCIMRPNGKDTPVRLKPNIAAHRFQFKLTSHFSGANIKRLSYVLR